MKTKIAGILNITPDSFQEVGRHLDPHAALDRFWQMIDDGADMIDIGAESTRPGIYYNRLDEGLSVEDEIQRLKPFLELLKNQTIPVPLSIDTMKYEVAHLCLNHGFQYVNDMKGLEDPPMRQAIKEAGAGAIITHNQGKILAMVANPVYDDVVREVYDYLNQQAKLAQEEGIQDIIIDPGIGVDKNFEHNMTVLKNISYFNQLGFPSFVGPSRKHFIGILTNDLPPEERLEGTLASVIYLADQQVDWVRVHDVKECKRALTVAEALWK